MPIPVDPNSRRDHILKCDHDKEGKPIENATVFEIGVLTPDDEADIEDNFGSMSYNQPASGKEDDVKAEWKTNGAKNVLKILNAGLKGVRNFFEKDGTTEIKLKKIKQHNKWTIPDEFLMRLTKEWRTELANAIMKENTVTEEEEVNLA